jgi:hypothetical protein
MTPGAVADLLIDAGARRVERWPVAGLRSIAHLAAKSKGRCGIYDLAFANGEHYVGQAVDVTARFVTHAQTYADIAEVFVWLRDPVAQFGLCGQGELEAGEVGCPGALQGRAGPPGVEADEVDGGGGEDVFEVDLADTCVAGAAEAGHGDGLADDGFDTGPGAVAGLPVVGGLFGPGGL